MCPAVDEHHILEHHFESPIALSNYRARWLARLADRAGPVYLPINDSLKRQVTLASIKNYRHGASKLRAQKYAAAGGVSKVPRTANGTGHTGPSECFATSI